MKEEVVQSYTFSNGPIKRKVDTNIGVGLKATVELLKEDGKWYRNVIIRNSLGHFICTKKAEIKEAEYDKLLIK